LAFPRRGHLSSLTFPAQRLSHLPVRTDLGMTGRALLLNATWQ
jgi:hypothetical protein